MKPNASVIGEREVYGKTTGLTARFLYSRIGWLERNLNSSMLSHARSIACEAYEADGEKRHVLQLSSFTK